MSETPLERLYTASAAERCKALVRGALPPRLRAVLRDTRARAWRFVHSVPEDDRLDGTPPWCSPDVWEKIVAGYARRTRPTLCEYGLGSSTLHHVVNLLPIDGTYVGIEHDPGWYARVLGALLRLSLSESIEVRLSGTSMEMIPRRPHADAEFVFAGRGTECRVHLKLRGNRECPDPHGATRDEMAPYVDALPSRCDVVVVDGVARKACIERVLTTDHLRPGGLLVLHDAGHGLRSWLGRPTLDGTRDYRPEVGRMLAAGGEVVNGRGIDTWPGHPRRRAMGPEAFGYPVEAAFLVRGLP